MTSPINNSTRAQLEENQGKSQNYKRYLILNRTVQAHKHHERTCNNFRTLLRFQICKFHQASTAKITTHYKPTVCQ